MVWHCAAEGSRAIPVGGVTTGVVAIRHCQVVIVRDVALRAARNRSRRRHLVVSRQRPTGAGVVEGVVGPGDGVVASGAVRRSKHAARR